MKLTKKKARAALEPIQALGSEDEIAACVESCTPIKSITIQGAVLKFAFPVEDEFVLVVPGYPAIFVPDPNGLLRAMASEKQIIRHLFQNLIDHPSVEPIREDVLPIGAHPYNPNCCDNLKNPACPWFLIDSCFLKYQYFVEYFDRAGIETLKILSALLRAKKLFNFTQTMAEAAIGRKQPKSPPFSFGASAENGITALHMAVKYQRKEWVARALNHPSEVKATGTLPVMVAAFNGDLDTVLALKADANKTDRCGLTALDYAVAGQQESCIRELMVESKRTQLGLNALLIGNGAVLRYLYRIPRQQTLNKQAVTALALHIAREMNSDDVMSAHLVSALRRVGVEAAGGGFLRLGVSDGGRVKCVLDEGSYFNIRVPEAGKDVGENIWWYLSALGSYGPQKKPVIRMLRGCVKDGQKTKQSTGVYQILVNRDWQEAFRQWNQFRTATPAWNIAMETKNYRAISSLVWAPWQLATLHCTALMCAACSGDIETVRHYSWMAGAVNDQAQTALTMAIQTGAPAEIVGYLRRLEGPATVCARFAVEITNVAREKVQTLLDAMEVPDVLKKHMSKNPMFYKSVIRTLNWENVQKQRLNRLIRSGKYTISPEVVELWKHRIQDKAIQHRIAFCQGVVCVCTESARASHRAADFFIFSKLTTDKLVEKQKQHVHTMRAFRHSLKAYLARDF